MFCTVCLKSSCLLICFHSWSLDLSQTLIQTIQILKEETAAPKPMEKQKTNKKNHPMSPVQLPLRPSPWVETFVFLFFSPTTLCGVLVFDSVSRCSSPPPPPAPPPTYNFVHLSHTTLPLSHTTLSHTNFHTQLCHTLSFTHNFVTHHLSHTTFPHTIFQTPLSHTNFVTHIHLHFTWQAWHKLTSTLVLRGRRGTYGIG